MKTLVFFIPLWLAPPATSEAGELRIAYRHAGLTEITVTKWIEDNKIFEFESEYPER